MRRETDLLGSMDIDSGMYFGIHTKRAMQNFNISNSKIGDFPVFIKALILTKKGMCLCE